MAIKKTKVIIKYKSQKPYKFVFDVSGWVRWVIDKKSGASIQQAVDDLKNEIVELDEDLEKFAVLKNILVDVIRIDQKTLVQDYSYSVLVTLPINQINVFKKLLNRDRGCEFDDYSWGDFVTSRSSIGSPGYLTQENERSYGGARSEAQLKKLWRVMYSNR